MNHTIHLPFGVSITFQSGERRSMTMDEARIWLARKTYTDCLAARRAYDAKIAASKLPGPLGAIGAGPVTSGG